MDGTPFCDFEVVGKIKREYWCGVPAIVGWKGAPMLEFADAVGDDKVFGNGKRFAFFGSI